MDTQSPKLCTSTLYVEINESFTKQRRPENFAAPSGGLFKFTHNTVAPSEPRAAPFLATPTDVKKTTSFLPSFFTKKSKDVEITAPKVAEDLPEVGKLSTGCVSVQLKTNDAGSVKTNEDDNASVKSFKLLNTLENKIFKLGERGSGIKSTGPVQDFYELRDQHLSSGTLFEDPQFPADDTSLTISRRPDRRYEWLRPGEIVDNPQLFVEGYSRFDVQQGELGDCWLLAAVANLTLYRRLFFQIVPDDQSFDENYAGIFHFRFWQYGRWVDVVIDDRLPTYRGQLVYLHSNEENEFWSALLEKAYAKLHGCYEALKGGSTCDAMEDFTGGVTEMYEMNSSPPNLFKIIMKAYERGSLMGSSLEPDPNVLEAETREGLVRGHAYSITRVKYVDIQTPNTVGKIPLLRLRNPWGNEIEWNGAWSDQMAFHPRPRERKLGSHFRSRRRVLDVVQRFPKTFRSFGNMQFDPDSLTEEEIAQGNKKQWEMSVFEGEWVRGVTSGGCRNYLETFWHNPQYRITLNESDDDDEEGKCTVIIALMQKNRRSRKMQGVEFLTIGFAVYYLPDPNRAPKPLDLNYFKYNASVARSPSFINLREVSCRFRLPPGTYCIVPSTFEPNDEGEFLLRVFSEHKNNMEYGSSNTTTYDQDSNRSSDKKQSDQVREYFKKIAGDDMEVDWEELKDILDFATRTELQVGKVSVRGAEAGVGGGRSNGFLGLICVPLCKTTPNEIVASAVPASTVSVAPTSRKVDETKNRGFSKDVARSIVALLDEDRSGKLGFEEFVSLWGLIRKSKAVFQKHDKDGTGSLNGFELREALTSVGYTLNNHILNILMHRYGNKQAEISFDDFILCGIKLKTMIEIFRKKNVSGGLSISVSFDDWIETTLYA
ncbi:hypothetical protein FQR65_LT00060 [Abscondita terminalis]|nr:hypothetical protein FQR65_LT00060 [Abscondita terminalis]